MSTEIKRDSVMRMSKTATKIWVTPAVNRTFFIEEKWPSLCVTDALDCANDSYVVQVLDYCDVTLLGVPTNVDDPTKGKKRVEYLLQHMTRTVFMRSAHRYKETEPLFRCTATVNFHVYR